MSSRIPTLPAPHPEFPIFVKLYYGAPYDFTEEAFASALSVCGLDKQDAYHIYGLNAPHIPDKNGLVPPQSACIRIFSSADSHISNQLVETFMKSMIQYEAPLPLRRPTTGFDAIAAAARV
jgi:hypothetical protein